MVKNLTAYAFVTLVLFSFYVVCYIANVERTTESMVVSGPGPWSTKPTYRNLSTSSSLLFFPIHKVDRIVRHDYWKELKVGDLPGMAGQ
jgi:hypothetical protein